MKGKIKILVPVIIVMVAVAVVLVFLLTKQPAKPKAKPKVAAAKSCSLLSAAQATKLLGKGTVLTQAKTSKVGNVNVIGCDYVNNQTSKSIVIGQKTPLTNYGKQSLSQAFATNVASNEAPIRFANYSGFITKNQPGNIRLWFKNTWLQIFSPSQTISEEALTNFVKSH